jgi:hypothetical protein
MINKHEKIVLVSTGMTLAFMVKSCQGDRTQEQQSVLKIAKITTEVHSMWHNIYIATETGRHMRAVLYYSMCLRKSDCKETGDLRCDEQMLPQ